MKNIVSISNARKDLPKMVKGIQKNPGTVFKIAVRNETIAELRSAQTMIQPGEAIRKLIHLRQKLSNSIKDKARESISKKVKDYLYPVVNQ
jgi:hypothetical protein